MFWRKARTRLQTLKRNSVGFLYSLIQPATVPDHPQAPPRLRVEILIAVLGLAGWGLFLYYYDQISPVASLDLRYSRTEVAQIAEDYLQARGVDFQDYHQVTTFGTDSMTQFYLERTVGVSQLQQLVEDGDVPVWTWYVRWFVPKQREEYRVRLLPTGEIVGFTRVLAEDTPAHLVSPAEAQRLAEAYLVDDRGLSLADWELYDVSATTLPHRTDHTLTWVRQGLETGDGDVRTSVVVQGDQVGRFSTWFRVPEAFSRAYTEQRSRAILLDGVATGVASLFLVGGALVVFWGLINGLKIGWAPLIAGLVAGLVDLLDSINYLPLLGAGYNTAVSYQSYILGRLAGYATSALSTALQIAFLILAAQWLLRAVWLRQHKFKPDVRAPWSQLARSSWRGLVVGGLMGAYLILFYAVAKGLGAWSPVRTPSLNLLATPFPFLAALWIGLLPALREELTYRALGTGLTMRLAGGRAWLALLVPSLVWGFAHASYITEPVGLRGIELTISSLLLLGLFFLLFDLTTTIVAHYTYNASLTAIILIRSGNPTFVLTGLVAVLLGLAPVVIGVIQWLRGRRRKTLPAPVVSVGNEADWAKAQALSGERLVRRDTLQRLVCLNAPDGQLLGYAVGEIVEQPSGDVQGKVPALFVHKPYRGRYYGTALYRALAEWFHAQGVDQVQAPVALGNAGASTFWATQGFRPRARVWSYTDRVRDYVEGVPQ